MEDNWSESPFTEEEENELAELADYEEGELINHIDNVEDFKEYIYGIKDAKYTCGQTIYYKKKYVELYINR